MYTTTSLTTLNVRILLRIYSMVSYKSYKNRDGALRCQRISLREFSHVFSSYNVSFNISFFLSESYLFDSVYSLSSGWVTIFMLCHAGYKNVCFLCIRQAVAGGLYVWVSIIKNLVTVLWGAGTHHFHFDKAVYWMTGVRFPARSKILLTLPLRQESNRPSSGH